MPSQRANTGYSGQMAVMSELLIRDCNAAIPVIDVGMDVFAFRDDTTDVARIQVKSAKGRRNKKGGYGAQFNIPLKHLTARDDPPLHFVLAVRLDQQWESFLVISRGQLQKYWNKGLGIVNQGSGDLALKIKYQPALHVPDNVVVLCGEVDLSEYLNAWQQLPPLDPPSIH